MLSTSGDRTLRLWDDQARSQRLEKLAQRARSQAQLAPRVAEWIAGGNCAAARAQVLAANGLSERARTVALQMVVARALASGN